MSIKATIAMNISINDNTDLEVFNSFISILFNNSELKDPLFKIERIEVVKFKENVNLEAILSSSGNDKQYFMKHIESIFYSFPLNITRKSELFELEEKINE
jgi:hypothetical protein